MARQSAGQPLRFDGIFDPGPLIYNEETGEEKPYAVYVTATPMAEVEVGMERGNVRVLPIVCRSRCRQSHLSAGTDGADRRRSFHGRRPHLDRGVSAGHNDWL